MQLRHITHSCPLSSQTFQPLLKENICRVTSSSSVTNLNNILNDSSQSSHEFNFGFRYMQGPNCPNKVQLSRTNWLIRMQELVRNRGDDSHGKGLLISGGRSTHG